MPSRYVVRVHPPSLLEPPCHVPIKYRRRVYMGKAARFKATDHVPVKYPRPPFTAPAAIAVFNRGARIERGESESFGAM